MPDEPIVDGVARGKEHHSLGLTAAELVKTGRIVFDKSAGYRLV